MALLPTELRAGPYTLRGVSVAGVYTSIQVPELGALLDVGIALRSLATTERIFLSHCHADHAGALPSLLGIRELVGKRPPQVYAPAEMVEELREMLGKLCRLHHNSLDAELVPVRPGDTFGLRRDLHVRAFRTHHSVPSVGYQFFRKVTKLKDAYRELPPEEIGRLRQAGASEIFEEVEHLELAYATDTLARVLDTTPSLLQSRVLVLECTYVGDGRTVEDAQERLHLHLDELFARADRIQNEHVVLMHFSQSQSPAAVHALIRERAPESLRERIRIFAPESGDWFG